MHHGVSPIVRAPCSLQVISQLDVAFLEMDSKPQYFVNLTWITIEEIIGWLKCYRHQLYVVRQCYDLTELSCSDPVFSLDNQW